MSFLNHKNNQEHTLPDVFTAVKHGVTARQVAEMYGIQVNAHGMACCPFHDDTHPSMKLDERYYCFGCHASGDAIDFVSNLFRIRKREAAVKIAEDFHVHYDPKGRPGRGQPVTLEQKKEWEMRQLQNGFREWRGKALSDLNGDYRILTERTTRFEPADRNAPFPKPFVQAHNDRTLVEFYIGLLETASQEMQIHLYLYDEGTIAALHDRVNGREKPRASVWEKLEAKKQLVHNRHTEAPPANPQRAAI